MAKIKHAEFINILPLGFASYFDVKNHEGERHPSKVRDPRY
jgi:hypothetical protein